MLICCIIIVIVALFPKFYDDSVFFSENESHIQTDIVDSYTVVDKQGKSLLYDKSSEKFNVINNILSTAKVYHEKNELYIYDEISSEYIVLKSNNKKIFFIVYCEKQDDGSILLILKDFCKNKSTRYLLDNHDYLVTTITEKDYNEIFR